MRYLVTGGAGFIGSHIVEELVRRSHSVVVLDDLSAGKEENLTSCSGRIEFVRGSVCDLPILRDACRKVDCVLHLAARTSVPESLRQPLEVNRVNVEGTLNVLWAARERSVRRVVFAGSCAVYGDTAQLPIPETHPIQPLSPYGVSKAVGELYAQVFGRAYGLENVSLRFFNVFGPRQDPSSQYSGVLARFLAAHRDGGELVIFGDGEQSRDFIYVGNIVDITLRAAETPDISGMVFNAGTGRRYTLNETVKLLEKVSGRAARVRRDPARAGDILHSQADVALARKHLGYEPRVSYEEGLRLTWEWYKSNPST